MKSLKKSKSKTILFGIALLAVFGWVFCLMLLIECKWYAYLCPAVVAALLVLTRKTGFWNGWRIFACWVFAVVLAYTGLIFGRPDLKVSFAGTLARESIRLVMQMPALQDGGLFSKGAEFASKVSKWKPPAGYTNQRFDLSESSLEILKNTGKSNTKLFTSCMAVDMLSDLWTYIEISPLDIRNYRAAPMWHHLITALPRKTHILPHWKMHRRDGNF